eukprot:4069413-Amphidinium_carterae.2
MADKLAGKIEDLRSRVDDLSSVVDNLVTTSKNEHVMADFNFEEGSSGSHLLRAQRLRVFAWRAPWMRRSDRVRELLHTHGQKEHITDIQAPRASGLRLVPFSR